MDRPQGRSGGIAAGTSAAPATFTGNRALQIEEPLIFEMGQPGRCGVDLPEPSKVKDRLNGLKRAGEIGLPGLSEPQVVQPISFCLVVHHGCPHRHPTEHHVRIGSEVEVPGGMP